MVQKTIFMFAMVSLELLAAGVLLVQASTSDIVSNVVTAQPIVDDQVKPDPVVVFEDRQRIAYCLIGALCGAFMSVAIFPGKHPADSPTFIRALALKFGCSAIGGIVLTPKAIHYCGWEANADNLITASFFLATIAVSVLHTALPYLERKLTGDIKNKIDSI